MLWKKESNRSDSLYVDFCTLYAKQHMNAESERSALKMSEKSDATSQLKRVQGNKLFGQSKWADAIEMYNESLCYAENGSKNISLAYANRSACFFKLKLYRECLADIDLAKDAGYPEDLLPKLDRRKVECLEAIDDGVKSFEKFEPTLSYPPDDRFPCIANVIEFKKMASDYSIVAKEDIGVGQTVAVEKAFLAYSYNQFGLKCNICLKKKENLFPCKNCIEAMFCCTECHQSGIHDYECGIKFSIDNNENGDMMKEIRVMLMVTKMFSNVSELIDFVQDAIRSDSIELPATLMDEKSKYRAFLKLPFGPQAISKEHFAFLVSRIYKLCLQIPRIGATFRTTEYRRFLMHLIGQHANVTNYNSARVKPLPQAIQRNGMVKHTQTGLIANYFGHSCAPNVFFGGSNGQSIYTTIRPIKKGEVLRLSLFIFFMEPKKVRQEIIWNHRRIKCKCSRCTGTDMPMEQRKQLAMDPYFKYIMANVSPCSVYDEHLHGLAEKCIAFLQKYGHGIWCDEIGIIADVYVHLIQLRLN